MDDLVAWRVFDFQRESGNREYPEPESPRPPEVRDLWHNAFHELVTANRGEIEQAIAARASVLSARVTRQFELSPSTNANGNQHLRGIELSRRVSPSNSASRSIATSGKLALVRKAAAPIQLGALTATVIGPFSRDLRTLRDEWNTWLRSNKEQLERLREQMERDARRLDERLRSTSPSGRARCRRPGIGTRSRHRTLPR